MEERGESVGVKNSVTVFSDPERSRIDVFVGCDELLPLERATLPFSSAKQNQKDKKEKGAGRVRRSGRKEQVWLLLSEGLL